MVLRFQRSCCSVLLLLLLSRFGFIQYMKTVSSCFEHKTFKILCLIHAHMHHLVLLEISIQRNLCAEMLY